MARERDSDNGKSPARVKLVNVRLSYPALWKARGFGKKQEGEKKYQASFIIDPEDRQGGIICDKIDAAIDYVKKEKWGKNPPKLKNKICFLEGDPDDGEEFDGMMVLRSSNVKKPKVFDYDRLEVEEGDDGAPYAGCYVDAIVTIWAQVNEYGQRINGSLEAVRFRDDGDPFGAPPVDPDEFDDDDDDDRGSRGRSRGRGRDKDDDGDDDDDRGSRRGRGRSRDRDDDGDDDDRGSRRRGRGRDDDEGDDDDRGSRRGRGRDKDDDEEDRGRSRRRGREDDDDDDRGSRRGRRDEDDGDDRGGRSRRSREDDDDGDRSSRRRGRDDDDGDDRDSGRSRRRRRDNDI